MFFFQAEDGIRDLTVTGVQTCALPISHLLGRLRRRPRRWAARAAFGGTTARGARRAARACGRADRSPARPRSEERRVGKECRSRWTSNQYKKRQKECMHRILERDERRQ